MIPSNHALNVTTVSKTISSGTLDNNNCVKVGNVVTASARIHTVSVAASGTYFKIPEGYRPPAQIRVMGYMMINNVGSVSVMTTISPDGDVTLTYSSSSTATQIGFSATYGV